MLTVESGQQRQQRAYLTLKWLGRAAMPALLFYEGFNLFAAHDALIKLAGMVGLKEADISALAWFISSLTVTGETITNMQLISPERDARALTGYQQLGSSSANDSTLLQLQCRRVAALSLMLTNFGLYSLPNVYTVYRLAGNNAWSIPLMIGVWTVAVAYNMMFTAKDVIASYEELGKKLTSVYAQLWEKNKLQFARCFLQGFVVFNFYYSVTMAYANAKFLNHQVNLPQLTIPSMAIGTLSVAYVMLPRIERQYRYYLAPFRSAHGHDITLITNEERQTAKEQLDAKGVTKLYARASAYALCLAGGAFYFAHKYSDLLLERELHQHAFSLLIGAVMSVLAFGFVFKTDYTHELNTAAAELKTASTEPMEDIADTKLEISLAAKVLAFLTNWGGSQATRTIAGFEFFHAILSLIGNDSLEDALVTDLMVCLIACPLIAGYYQPKLENNNMHLFNYAGELFAAGRQKLSRQIAAGPVAHHTVDEITSLMII